METTIKLAIETLADLRKVDKSVIESELREENKYTQQELFLLVCAAMAA